MNPSKPLSENVRAAISELLSVADLDLTPVETRLLICRRVDLLLRGSAPWRLSDASIDTLRKKTKQAG